MIATIRKQRFPLYGSCAISALLAGLVAFNHALAPSKTQRFKPSFEFHPSRNFFKRKRLFIGFHGLWSGPGRYGPLLDLMRGQGSVLLANNGADVNDTPAATLRELKQRKLLEREICVIGFSLGTQTAVQFLREYLKHFGRPVKNAILISGMPTPGHVIWPGWYLPLLVKALEPGPIVELGWKKYWEAKLRLAKRSNPQNSPGTLSNIEDPLRMHPGSAISGARLLLRGVSLKSREFQNTKALVIEHKADSLVRPGYDEWKQAFPNSRHVVIPYEGHADFCIYPQHYRSAIQSWL